jgi:hypothetical protein
MKELGREWKEMTPIQKEPWNLRAKQAKDKYKEELKQYKKLKFDQQEKNKNKEEEEGHASDKSEESIKEAKEFETIKKAFQDKKAKRRLLKQQAKVLLIFLRFADC